MSNTKLIGSQKMPKPGDPLRYSFGRLWRCCKCASSRLRFYRTDRAEDGAVIIRYSRCKDCGHRFLLILD